MDESREEHIGRMNGLDWDEVAKIAWERSEKINTLQKEVRFYKGMVNRTWEILKPEFKHPDMLESTAQAIVNENDILRQENERLREGNDKLRDDNERLNRFVNKVKADLEEARGWARLYYRRLKYARANSYFWMDYTKRYHKDLQTANERIAAREETLSDMNAVIVADGHRLRLQANRIKELEGLLLGAQSYVGKTMYKAIKNALQKK